MNTRDTALFAAAGTLSWAGCTGFYAAYGAAFIEHAFWFYVLNAALCAVGMGLTFRTLVRVLRISRDRQLAVAVVFALPALVLALAVTPFLSSLFSRAVPETLGRYAGYLLFAYCGVAFTALGSPPMRPVAVPAH